MNKRDYYLTCIRNKLYEKRDWVISAFSVVRKRPYIADVKYAYQLIYDPRDPDRIWTAVPTDNGYEAVMITDMSMDRPPYIANEPLIVQAGECPMITEVQDTTYGIILGNMYLLYYPFGTKFKFVNGEIPESISDRIADLLTDNVKPGEIEKHDRIYVRELIRFGDGCDMLAAFDKLFTFSGSNKLLTVDPKVIALRDELVAKYKDQLHDPRIQAYIEDQVVKADKESFKGDPAEKFLVSGKSFNPTRKKQLIMIGGSAGFGGADGGTSSFIASSLRDGWKIADIPIHANEARAGSFFRGKETAAGGTDVIVATRMGMNTRISEDYCGSDRGIETLIDKANFNKYLGLSVVSGTSPVLLTRDNIESYQGKKVMLHSPSYCKTKGDAYCATCVGVTWSRLKDGMNNVLSNIGDVFMYDRMKRMHGKALKTATFVLVNHVN